jgi:hypothetical protein
MSNFCTKCGEPCVVVFVTEYDKDEFWGVPCKREYTEAASECCDAEVEERDSE